MTLAMWNRKLWCAICIIIVIASVDFASAQDIGGADENVSYTLPAIAVIDIEGVPPVVDLNNQPPGGDLLTDIIETSWLNYTSVVAPGMTNKITVAITGGQVPQSTSLEIYVHPDVGEGNGTTGIPVDGVIEADGGQEPIEIIYRELQLSETDVITGIGTCYTGSGTNKGHLIRYKWSVLQSEYDGLIASTGSVDVTYTIIAQ